MSKTIKTNILVLYIIILTLFFVLNINAQVESKFISISNNWNYNFYKADNKDFSNLILIKSGQTNMPVSFNKLLLDYEKRVSRGVVEFTKKIDIKNDPKISNLFKQSRFLGIYFGKLIDCSEIYINGVLVSKNGIYNDIYFTSWNKNILVKIPNTLKLESFKIKIRVYFYPEGSAQDYLYFGDYYELKRIERINNFIDVDLKLILLLISLLFAIIFLYIGKKLRITYYIYFAFLILLISLFTIIYVITNLPIDHSIFNYLFEYKSLYLALIFLILFICSYIDKELNFILKAGIYISLIGFILDTIIYDRTIRLGFYQIFNIFLYLIFVYIVTYVVIEYLRTKSKNSKDIILPILILFLCLTNDFIAFKYPDIIKKFYPKYLTLKYLNIFGFQSFVIYIASRLVGDLVNSFYKLRKFTKELDSISFELEKRKTDLAENVQKILDETKDSFIISENLSNTGSDFSKIIHNLKQQIEKIKESLKTSNLNEEEVFGKVKQLTGMLENVRQGNENTNEILANVINKINQIIENTRQIDIIVEQTSLLSLNSSVVAGKAKEKGRGFSIISDEIRKLAMKSADFSSNAQKGIDAIVDSVKEVRLREDEFLDLFIKYSNQFMQLSELITKNKDNHNQFIQKIESLDKLIVEISLLAQEIDSKSKVLYSLIFESKNVNFEN